MTTRVHRLFDEVIVSHARRSRASLPVSLALHGMGVAALLALPALAPLAPPEDPPSGPVVFRLPQPLPVVQAATRPLPVRPAGPARVRPVSAAPVLRQATQAAPTTVPDALPAPEDAAAVATLDIALPFGPGCTGPECVVGLAGAGHDGHGDDDGARPGDGAEGSGRVRVSGRDVSPPVKLHDVAPVYPEAARRIRLSGVVLIACIITPDGRVADARVLSGPPLLDAAALQAVRQWRYRPTRVGGAPVSVALNVTVHFRLDR